MRETLRSLGLVVAVLLALAGNAAAEPRLALVIGNSGYGADIGALPNPANDAKLIAKTLRGIGFTVMEVEDADRQQMTRSIADFGAKLAQAGMGATGLFYYAGHGVQSAGENYLIPIGAKIARETELDIEAVPVTLILKQMDFADGLVNIVILDACRNNPLSRGFRSASRGLAEAKIKPHGSFIAYSTAPGEVAADGSGRNSPYTTALAQSIVTPGLGIEEVFRDIRGKVLAATGQAQTPWDSSSLTVPFYFVPEEKPAPAPAPIASSNAVDPKTIELAFWDTIKNSDSPEDFEAYLAKFPDGDFARLAKNRLKALSGASAARTGLRPPTMAEVTPPAPAPAAPPPDQPGFADTTAQLYAKEQARLRSAPTADAPVVARLAADTPLTATGRSADGKWWRVSLADGKSGFIAASAVSDQPNKNKVTAPDPNETVAQTPSAGDDAKACASESVAAAADRIAACQRRLDSGSLNKDDRYNALLILGNAQWEQVQYEDALRSYHAAIALDPNGGGPYYNSGLVNMKLGNYPEARAAFEKAVPMYPGDPDALYQRGMARANVGEADLALQDLRDAINIKSDVVDYYDQIGVVAMAKGDAAKAAAFIDMAIAVDPGYWGGGGVFAYYLTGRFDEAMAMADRAFKDNPDYAYWPLWKALALKAKGDSAGAAAAMAEAQKVAGENWPAPVMAYVAGKIDESKLRVLARSGSQKAQAERLCEIDFYIGELAYLNGDQEKARRTLENAANSRIYYYYEYSAAKARLALLNQQ